MKTYPFHLLVAAMFLARVATAADFYVAPAGGDGNPGDKEKPFATLEAARDAARRAGAGPHRVVVQPGDYFLTKTLELDARDNGLTIEAGTPGKTTLYGGTRVTGWRRDGGKFWCADLDGVKEGTRDFRSLVVNGRLADRARLPETEAFTLTNVWSGHYLSGAWDPKPSQEQLTTVLYDPKDVPAGLDARNAEIRVYHMWDDSLCGVATNVVERHALVLASPTRHPPAAFGVRKFVIFNTREGMTRPGEWYLDRTAGRVVYWPLPGEEMSKVWMVAPQLERIIQLTGTPRQPVEKITLRGLRLEATSPTLGARGFGATGYGGAVHADRSRDCLLERLEVTNVGGEGIVFQSQDTGSQVLGCHVHHTGACGVEIARGAGSRVAQNHIHHVGLQYPCAVGLTANGEGLHLYRNEIHDGPYSGIACMGARNYRVEENLIYRIMREMHDGAAIYATHLVDSVLRGNLVRDVVETGKGYGASAYYLDEQSHDSIVERNVAIGVPMVLHLHINRHSTIRDNVFITEGDMLLAFSRSADCIFERNTLFVPGQVKFVTPNAITCWKENVVFRNGLGTNGVAQPMTIDAAMPPVPPPPHRPVTLVRRVTPPPTVDGEIGLQEWPGSTINIDRLASRQEASGVPIYSKFSYDDRCLYLAVGTGIYDNTKLRKGAVWGQDDGAEIAIAGQSAGGHRAVFVIRGYPDGTVQSVTDAGAPADAARHLGTAVRFAATTWRHGWRGEWAIPLEALGIKPAPGIQVPFNVTVFRAEDALWRFWEGTGGESWQVDKAGVLVFK